MVFTVVILINPVFAYNEKEQQCIDDIPDDATDLERRAAIKECTKYKMDAPADTKDGDKFTSAYKIVEGCDAYYEHYKRITETQYTDANRSTEARQCLQLFKDDVWNYDGDDRLDVLAKRLLELEEISLEENEKELEKNTMDAIEDSMSNFKITETYKKILVLEDRVYELENSLKQKDLILMEQVKVILSLTEQLRVVFSQIFSPFLNV